MRYSKRDKLYGYLIIDSEGSVLDGVDDVGNLHFTPQYLLDETSVEPIVFYDRYRLPRNITSKLDASYGLLEVKLDKEGKANADAILEGRIIGSIASTITTPNNIGHGKTGRSDMEYMSRAVWRDNS